jgi:hypothetical protein
MLTPISMLLQKTGTIDHASLVDGQDRDLLFLDLSHPLLKYCVTENLFLFIRFMALAEHPFWVPFWYRLLLPDANTTQEG